ncbi:urea carboxylase [Serratia rubidaea]|uniref:Urea carboxylase n=1 Tax=Serratia rubidaea TaxID=61652 RepID=A0A4U9HBY1_SERRU|nr:urea carboxylase [Serratia rubidaea]
MKAITLPPPSLAPAGTVSAAVLARLEADHGLPAVTYRQAGDGYLLMEYGDNVLDLASRLRIHLLMQSLRRSRLPALRSWRPACARCRSVTTAAPSRSRICCRNCWRANARWRTSAI